ncbi:MAG: tandem-95 repeat protein [Prolixibacteraceae bacterium]|nr:tandem-95 repeat protein [Prolixibacteraceae bacterium]
MKLCGSLNWCRIGWLVVFFNLIVFPYLSYSQNLPPVMDKGIPNQHAEVGEVFTYTIPANAFKDDDYDDLTITITGSIPGLTISDETISGTPTTANTYTLNVTASDGSLSTSRTFKIYVHPSGATYAAFTMDVQQGCNSLIVDYTNKSKGATTYTWDLGNSNVSSLANPVNTIYGQPGTYSVRLTINGGEATFTETISVYPKPQPAMDKNLLPGCEPHELTFTSTGSPVNVAPFLYNNDYPVAGISGGSEKYYEWYLNGKEAAITPSNPTSVSDIEGGNYNITLVVSDENGCSASKTEFNLLEVYDRPEASFTYLKDDNCAPSQTDFINTSEIEGSEITSYAWYVEGELLGTDEDFSYDFTDDGYGSYAVSLRDTSEWGCISELFSDTIKFNNDNSADFTISPETTCLGDTTRFTSLVSATIEWYEWDFNNDGITDATVANPSWVFATAGNKTITLRAIFNDGCSEVITQTTGVEQINADFSYNITPICHGGFDVLFTDDSESAIGNAIVSWLWEWEQSGANWVQISTASTFTRNFLDEGNQNIRLTVTSEDGCTAMIEKSINLELPSIDFKVSGATLGCLPAGPTNFAADCEFPNDSPQTYTWDFGDGSPAGSGTAVSHNYTDEGNYSVELIVVTTKGCTYTRTRANVVSLADQPWLTPVLDQSNTCFSTGITIDVDYYYPGTDSLRFITPYETIYEDSPGSPAYEFEYTFRDTGHFDIGVVAINNGCASDIAWINDIEITEPRALFSPSQNTFCEDPPYDVSFDNNTQFTDSATTFEWNFGDGSPVSNEFEPDHTYGGTGDYIVTLTVDNPNNGCSHTYRDTINIYSFDETATGMIEADVVTGCAPLTVNFSQTLTDHLSDNYVVSLYDWDFDGDGSIDSIKGANPTYTYDTPGTYSVSLYVRSNDNSCDYNFTEAGLIQVSGPIVNFSVTPAIVCINSEVQFTNESTKGPDDPADPALDVFSWDFGDGGTSTDEHPFHTYTRDTIFDVSLTVTDQFGCSATLVKDSFINILPFTPAFEIGDTLVCSGSTVTFTNVSEGEYTQFQWDFDGNGSTDLTTYNLDPVTRNYPTGGMFHPVLTLVSPNGCTKQDTAALHVVNATARFSALSTNIGCAPANAFFQPVANENEVISYLWDFGDGSTSTERAPRHRYFMPGYYTVSLRVVFRGGCDDSYTLDEDIYVKGAYGVLAFDNLLGCVPNEVEFTVSDMREVDYIRWDFGNGDGHNDTIPPGPPIPEYSTSYTYYDQGVTLPGVVLTSQECGDYSYGNNEEIYSSLAPSAGFKIDNDSICQGVEIQFTDTSTNNDLLYPKSRWKWIFDPDSGDSDTSNVRDPSYAYPVYGLYRPMMIVSNSIGCSDTATFDHQVKIYNPANMHAVFDVDDALVCAGQEVQFTDLSYSDNGDVNGWDWDFMDGESSDNQYPTHAFNENQKGNTLNVTLVATDDKLCTATTTRTVAIDNLQAVPGYSPQPVYRGAPVDFNDNNSVTSPGTAINNWQWTFGGGSPGSSDEPDPDDILYENISANNVISLWVENDNGCSDDSTFYLDVLNNPPIIEDFMVRMWQNSTYTFRPDSFEAHFDEPNDPGQFIEAIRIESLPANGVLSFADNPVNTAGMEIPTGQIGSLRFTPTPGWFGNTSFEWNAYDGAGWATFPATVNIEVMEEPDPPTLSDVIFDVSETTEVAITFDDFSNNLSNTTIPEGEYDLDTLQVLSILSGGVRLVFNGIPVSLNQKFSRGQLQSGNFAVIFTSGYTYHEGTETFRWNAYDGYNWGDSPAEVIVNYINEAPVLTAIIREGLPEDEIQTIDKTEILSHYSDADAHDNATTFYLNIPPGTPGFFRINNAVITGSYSIPFISFNEVRYSPPAGFNGTVEVEWGASDGQDVSFDTIRFVYVNTPPVAHDLWLNDGTEDNTIYFTTSVINFRNAFEDADPNDELQQIEITSLPEHGILNYNVAPVVIGQIVNYSQISRLNFVPDTDWNGTDHFLYNASDGTDWALNDSTVYFRILPVNDPPVAVNDTFYIEEDNILQNVSVIDNDEDVDDTEATLAVRIDPGNEGTADENGLITLSPNGILRYQPDPDVNGEVSFIYTLCDDDSACSEATVTIIINPVNDPPVANDDILIYPEDSASMTINFGEPEALLSNDTDVDGDELRVNEINGSSFEIADGKYGILDWNIDGSYTYYPFPDSINHLAAGETIIDTFTYVIHDRPEEALTDIAMLFIYIIGANDLPIANNDTLSIYEDTRETFVPEEDGLLANDSDPDRNLIIVQIDGVTIDTIQGNFGKLAWDSTGAFTYTSSEEAVDPFPEGVIYTDVFEYRVSDRQSDETTGAYLFVRITGQNDAPFANNHYDTIYENQGQLIRDIPEKGILAEDWDIDRDNIGIDLINGTANKHIDGEFGRLDWGSNGIFVYTLFPFVDSLAAGAAVIDSFRYVISDVHDATDTAWLVISIFGENDPPTALNDSVFISEDTLKKAFNNPEESLLFNDSDRDGDAFTLYQVEGSPNDSTLSEYCALKWDSTGAFTYYRNAGLDTLPLGLTVTDSILYTIIDDHDSLASAYLYIYIEGENDAPVAVRDDNSLTESDENVSGTEVQNNHLLENDWDIDINDTIMMVSVNGETGYETTGRYGSLTWNDLSEYTYELVSEATDSLYNGEIVWDFFPYTIEDRVGATGTDTLWIKITGTNDKPVAINDTIEIEEDYRQITLTPGIDGLLDNDVDVDGDNIIIRTFHNHLSTEIKTLFGNLEWGSDGSFTYTLNEENDTLRSGEVVSEQFDYIIRDSFNSFDTAKVVIIITGNNDNPVAVNDSVSIDEDTESITGLPEFGNGLLSNDTDIDGDTLFVSEAETLTIYGELDWDSLGTYIFNTNREETDKLRYGEVVYAVYPYVASDIFGGTDTAELVVEIIGVNDPPVAVEDFYYTEDMKSVSLTAADEHILFNDYDVDGDVRTLIKVDDRPDNVIVGKYGTLTWNDDGTFNYVPDSAQAVALRPGETAIDSFSYIIEDEWLASDTSLFLINIIGINNAPLAWNDTLRLDQNMISKALSPSLIPKSVHDPDRDTLKLIRMQGITNPVVSGANGELFWDTTGQAIYTPNRPEIFRLGPDQYITEAFTYTVADGEGLTADAQLIVEIMGRNDALTANDDQVTVEEDKYIAFNVVENDEDPDYDGEGNFDYSSLTILTAPKHGKAFVNSVTGVIYYYPEKDFTGSDSLKYRISDMGSPVYRDSAWMLINVIPVNDPPVATPLVLLTPWETPVQFEFMPQVSDVDNTINSGTLEYPAESENGTIAQSGTELEYTPANGFSGIDEFTYSLSDGEYPAYVVVTVIVRDTLSAFRAQNDNVSTPEETEINIDILLNDTIGGDSPDPRTVEIKVHPVNGTAIYDFYKQSIIYEPAEGFNGTDSLEYIVSSGLGAWDYAWVFINVTPVKGEIMVFDDLAKTFSGQPVIIDVLKNDYVDDNDNGINPATLTVTSQPEHGDAVTVNGKIKYTPENGFTDTYEFRYQVCNLDAVEQSCDEATVTVVVKPLGSEFVAMNDYYETKEDSAFVLNPHPTNNDHNSDPDIETDITTFEVLEDTRYGTTRIDYKLDVKYYPGINYNGPDWVRYTISDTAENWDVAEINIWVEPVNDPPVAADDSYLVTENTFSRLYVLKNDFDVDSELDWQTLDISGEGAQIGDVEIDRNTGTLRYKPWVNEGEESFNYTICDIEGACATATVNITVELDTAIYVQQTMYEDTPDTLDIVAALARYNFFFDVETFAEELAPVLGSYEFIENNTLLVFTPDQDINGHDRYSLNLCSDAWQCASLNVAVTIIPVNDGPVAVNDTITWVDEANPLQINFSDILQNDYDVDNDPILLTTNSVEQGQSLSISFNGIDSLIIVSADTILWCDNYFRYEIKDPDGLSDTGRVYIMPVLNGIEALDDTVSLDENSKQNLLDVLANDLFKDNQRCTIDSIVVVTPPEHGEAAGTSDNYINYVPYPHYYGPDSLEYEIIDIWGQTANAWAYIDVIQRNMPPVANDDDTLLVEFGGILALPVLDNDYDPDTIDDPNAYIDIARTHLVPGSGPEYGTVEFNPETGEFIYHHYFETCSDDEFQYTIFDNEGDSATATVRIDLPDEAALYAVADTVRTYPGIPVEFYPLANDSGYFMPYIADHTNPGNGYVSFFEDNTMVTYYPNTDFMGRDSMIYTLVSPCGNTGNAYIIFLIEELKVPEIISPNGDGKNDVLIIDGIHYFPGNMLQIFNRYGHVVYEQRDYKNDWGGYSNRGSLFGNKPLPAGTYYYTLIYNEGKNRQAGFIYLFW